MRDLDQRVPVGPNGKTSEESFYLTQKMAKRESHMQRWFAAAAPAQVSGRRELLMSFLRSL